MSYLDKFNINNNKIICLCGLPASGKSTIADKLKSKGYEIISFDKYKLELIKSINKTELSGELNNIDKDVWDMIRNKLKYNIENDIPSVLDANLINEEQRSFIINIVGKNKSDIICIDDSLEEILNRNLKRTYTMMDNIDNEDAFNHYIDEDAIKLMNEAFTLPSKCEGFNTVEIIYNDLEVNYNSSIVNILRTFKDSSDSHSVIYDLHNNGRLKYILPELDACWGIDQQNDNHNLSLSEHMIEAASYLKNESMELYLSALLHDIGKLKVKKRFGITIMDGEYIKAGSRVSIETVPGVNGFVRLNLNDYENKQYINELLTIKHVAMEKNCSYNNHNLIGARMARRLLYKIGLHDILDEVYDNIVNQTVISYDIMSFNECSEIINKYGKYKILNLLKLRYANILSSNTTEDKLNIYFKNKQLILDLIGDLSVEMD